MSLDDTDPAARRVHIALLREAGPRRRGTIASDLTNQALTRARRAIDRCHPELSPEERRLLFVAVHYGTDIAQRVRARLAEASSE